MAARQMTKGQTMIIVGTSRGLVKQKTIKLVFVASPLRTQH